MLLATHMTALAARARRTAVMPRRVDPERGAERLPSDLPTIAPATSAIPALTAIGPMVRDHEAALARSDNSLQARRSALRRAGEGVMEFEEAGVGGTASPKLWTCVGR